MEKEWQGYIGEILDSGKSYVDTKKNVMIEDMPFTEKTVRTEDILVVWHEGKGKEIVYVERTYR